MWSSVSILPNAPILHPIARLSGQVLRGPVVYELDERIGLLTHIAVDLLMHDSYDLRPAFLAPQVPHAAIVGYLKHVLVWLQELWPLWR